MNVAKIMRRVQSKNDNPYPKVFCVGMNKTGTTSLNEFMDSHGFHCNNQSEGELLVSDFLRNDLSPILRHCQSADFFQDIPFSIPALTPWLTVHFPDALFILTIRKNAAIWYNSLTRFHRKKFGKNGNLPTRQNLENADYRYKGFAMDAHKALFPTPYDDLYNRSILIETYKKHIADVSELFKDRNNLLILDLADANAVTTLCTFLKVEPQLTEMPWLNKSETPEK